MMSLGQVALAVVAAILIPVVLHFWTQGVHKRTRAPNWSLLHMFNCLILFLFLLSTFQMFRTRGSLTRKETPAGYLSIWGLIICVTLVYFFSVFGVALTHLVLEDDDYHPNGVMPQRESDDMLSAKNIERSSSPPLPGDSSCTACSDGKGHTHSACAHSGGGANGEGSGRVSQQYPNTLESLEVLRSVNERVATANSVADVWGQGAILWGLTNSDSVTVDMLRETQIGRTVGQFTKRNCAKCGTCEWCLLMAKWRKMAVKEMKIKAAPCTVGDGCSSHPTSGGGGGGGGGASGFSFGAGPSHGSSPHEVKEIVLARVLVGQPCEMGPDSSLRMPPMKANAHGAGSQDRYDSVTGMTGGSRVYVTYDNGAAKPAYKITYRG
mmetsp:Transcript_65646/g.181669  ORF Transcript_65646/g.181669 Transcript_65646/m.181669 type:complete len:380 (+) Transcript_65646:383-1522(+)